MTNFPRLHPSGAGCPFSPQVHISSPSPAADTTPEEDAGALSPLSTLALAQTRPDYISPTEKAAAPLALRSQAAWRVSEQPRLQRQRKSQFSWSSTQNLLKLESVHTHVHTHMHTRAHRLTQLHRGDTVCRGKLTRRLFEYKTALLGG